MILRSQWLPLSGVLHPVLKWWNEFDTSYLFKNVGRSYSSKSKEITSSSIWAEFVWAFLIFLGPCKQQDGHVWPYHERACTQHVELGHVQLVYEFSCTQKFWHHMIQYFNVMFQLSVWAMVFIWQYQSLTAYPILAQDVQLQKLSKLKWVNMFDGTTLAALNEIKDKMKNHSE